MGLVVWVLTDPPGPADEKQLASRVKAVTLAFVTLLYHVPQPTLATLFPSLLHNFRTYTCLLSSKTALYFLTSGLGAQISSFILKLHFPASLVAMIWSMGCEKK
jgi:hypothetical protein